MPTPDISRFWRYRYGSWQPQWYRYLIPDFRGSDELGRRTVVFHVPFLGFLVWAYRTCKCEDCCEVREKELWRDWHATT